ncbi:MULTISPECIES: TM2 domain-containing protein [Flavobacterium]|jgi:TM2 domain-containing membrane protein YozV|uniref:TM2 domain-containing protein n=1 Tax=Flavobacterium TaxID=237 RepID=UPI0009D9EB15|nr:MULTISPECIES: NINE protein [Flavobacterium]MDL2142926.1 NINE protein [Flavobacterium tructae]URC12624.1 NINE protein [Flavobacterium sp. B183]
MKSKLTATILTFFLGGLGIHKFYLGKSTQGIMYILFCWTLIPSILAFFEFFGLLFMSDHSFNVKYNNGF